MEWPVKSLEPLKEPKSLETRCIFSEDRLWYRVMGFQTRRRLLFLTSLPVGFTAMILVESGDWMQGQIYTTRPFGSF